MKSLLLVRHAKSSWDFNVDDFDRPLNSRGKSDAPEMAERLLKRDVKIDAFISSPANRALSTATAFAEAYGLKHKDLIIIPSLYESSAKTIEAIVAEFDNDYKRIAIFCHNPGITDYVNSLTSVRVDDLPTCAIYAVKADVKNWKNFAEAQKEFWFFDYPKAL